MEKAIANLSIDKNYSDDVFKKYAELQQIIEKYTSSHIIEINEKPKKKKEVKLETYQIQTYDAYESHKGIRNMGEFYSRNLILDVYKSPNLRKKYLPISKKEIEEFRLDTEELVEEIRNHLMEVIRFSCCAEFRHFKNQIMPNYYYGKCCDTSTDIYRSFVRNCPNPECFTYLRERRKGRKIVKNPFNFNDWREKRSYLCPYKDTNLKLLRAFKNDEYSLMKNVLFGFEKFNWDDSYGGLVWANGVEAWFRLYNAKTYQEKVIAIDHAYDLQHHGGLLFNKHPDWKNCDGLVDDFLHRKSIAKDVSQIIIEDGYSKFQTENGTLYNERTIACRPKNFRKILSLARRVGYA
jgi:hypothetical protein